jgi:hypothetical protein
MKHDIYTQAYVSLGGLTLWQLHLFRLLFFLTLAVHVTEQ